MLSPCAAGRGDDTPGNGVTELGASLHECVAGVVMRPVEGARTEGASGFVRGLGRGLVARPSAGVLSLGSGVMRYPMTLVARFEDHEAPLRPARAMLMGRVGGCDGWAAAIESIVQRLHGKGSEVLLSLTRNGSLALCIFTRYVFVLQLPALKRAKKAKTEMVLNPRSDGRAITFGLANLETGKNSCSSARRSSRRAAWSSCSSPVSSSPGETRCRRPPAARWDGMGRAASPRCPIQDPRGPGKGVHVRAH